MVTTTELIRLSMIRGKQSPPTSPSLRHPNDVNATIQMQRAVVELNELFRPTNTSKAHQPKVAEFFEYCEVMYKTDPYKYHLSFEKIYRFMYYQAFRPLKPRGGKRKYNNGVHPVHKVTKRRSRPLIVDEEEALDEVIEEEELSLHFERAIYDEVMTHFTGDPSPSGSSTTAPLPVQALKPISWSTFDQYKQVLRKIHREQQLAGANSLVWEQIWKSPLDDLAKQVKGRVAHVRRSTYQEKFSAAFSSYATVERYNDIEEALWEESFRAHGPRELAAKLRHRYCATHTASGILRCESLYRAEWSDFLCVTAPRTDTDVHPVDIMVNVIAEGKTNKGRRLYGRAIRHRDVRLCCFGSLSFYALYRFNYTNEFMELTVDDWFDNSKWFDIKLLCDLFAGDRNTKEMVKDSYGDTISKVLKKLGLPACKLLHFGRQQGSKMLAFLEETDEAIRKMGQWNPSVFDNSYSAKLPMGPMRKLAGFHGSQQMYFNTRTSVEVPAVLRRCTPLGWVYDTYKAVMEDPRSRVQHTAPYVLRFFMKLNEVMLQDSAAMQVLHPERCNHPFFESLAVLQTKEFADFRESMKHALETVDCPLDANLEKVMPGVHQWHQATNDSINSLSRNVSDLKGELKGELDNLYGTLVTAKEDTKLDLAKVHMAIALQLMQGGVGDVNTVNMQSMSNLLLTSPQPTMRSPETTTTAATTVTPTTQDPADLDINRLFRMKPKHSSLIGVLKEWYGLDEFADELGGIQGRIDMYKSTTKWRKHCMIHPQHFSRTMRTVRAVEEFARKEGVDRMAAAAHLEEDFAKCEKSVAAFVTLAQSHGLLSKRSSRITKSTGAEE